MNRKEEIKWIIFESMMILLTLMMCNAIVGYELGIYIFVPFLILCVGMCMSLRGK